MAENKSKRQEKASETQVEITIKPDLLTSPAFRSLNKTSILVYLDFRMKYKMEKMRLAEEPVPADLLNEIKYTYKDAEENGITSASFSRALKELLEKGFISVVKKGTGGVNQSPSIFNPSGKWKKYRPKGKASSPSKKRKPAAEE